MDEQQTFLTQRGYDRLKEELDYLRTVRRKEIAKRLELAMEEGELIENAELEDARNEQAFVEGRILTLKRMLHNVVIIEEEEGPHDSVQLGSRVTVVEGDGPQETYHVVGSAEADPTQGMISNVSPLGQALMGHKVGDTVQIKAPAGVLSFEIVDIE